MAEVDHPPWSARQADRLAARSVPTSLAAPGPGGENGDRQGWAGGHGNRFGDRDGVGTVMVTSDAVPRRPYRVTGVSSR